MVDFMLNNAFCERFALTYPIIQAPMAGVSNPVLAASVRRAGALPSLGCGAMSASTLEKTIREYMDLTGEDKRPLLNINFFSHQEALIDERANQAWLQRLAPVFEGFAAQPPSQLELIYQSLQQVEDERLEVVLKAAPQIVSFHFGLPSTAVLAKLRAQGVAIFATACDLNDAKQLEAAGVDYIVAQGYEAGGHRGIFDANHEPVIATLELLQLLKKECSTPIIAAGGIMTGHEIRTMMAHGADAVQLGTAFILCPESSASTAYRRQLSAQARQNQPETVVSAAISGRPARGLRTKLSDLGAKLEQEEGLTRPAYPFLYDVNKQLNDAALKQGEEGYGAYWSGAGLAAIREMPASELVALLAQEAFED
ncbi:NAD(P)H-dependent flavin oxidoreductase [Oligella urethralis]|uniref:NAD(P)H-dependent flavin oxidoreductase n=1 Tax=Oligella urethralis TaxID=90245 RepID=UPI0024304E6D|nr:nitronate monooxygenase [Oligella urethralis]